MKRTKLFGIFFQSLSSMLLAFILLVSLAHPIAAFTGNPVASEQNTQDFSATMLVLDTSGSMNDNDVSGITKIDAARNSAGAILNIIDAENQAGANNLTGVVRYDNDTEILAQLSNDIQGSKNAVQSIFPGGGTGMAAGLSLGIQQFNGVSSPKKILILLSDGLPNIPFNISSSDLVDIQNEIYDLARQAGSQNICVYTIGFGDPDSDSIDEEFLKNVASYSGCGAYYPAKDAIQLMKVFIELRHTSTGGDIIFNETYTVSQGQTLDLNPVQVKDNQETMLITVQWPGSRVEINLRDPDGIPVDLSYINSKIVLSPTLISVIVNQPKPGFWKLSVVGVDVPEGTMPVHTIFSTRPGPVVPPTPVINTPTPIPATPTPLPTSSGASIGIVFLILAVAGVGIYVYSKTLKRGGGHGNAHITGISGEFSGKVIPLVDGFVIGRGSSNHLHLSETSVSRQHAVIRYTQGEWYIQDQGSALGTLVNNQRINATRLKSGDQIRIGSNVFIFSF